MKRHYEIILEECLNTVTNLVTMEVIGVKFAIFNVILDSLEIYVCSLKMIPYSNFSTETYLQ